MPLFAFICVCLSVYPSLSLTLVHIILSVSSIKHCQIWKVSSIWQNYEVHFLMKNVHPSLALTKHVNVRLAMDKHSNLLWTRPSRSPLSYAFSSSKEFDTLGDGISSSLDDLVILETPDWKTNFISLSNKL